MSTKKIIIAGGTGYLGRLLQEHFSQNGFKVVVLSRKPSSNNNGITFVQWDAKTKGDWQDQLENSDVLINLTGKSINCLFTKKNKKEILDSRIHATQILNETILGSKNPPKVFINASGISIYKSGYHSDYHEENEEFGSDFLAEVCKQWEHTFYKTKTPKTRKVALRISPVLGKESNAIKSLLPVVKMGLGGKQGHGKQLFAWVHESDVINSIDFILHNKNITGSVNLISPEVITNAEFMKKFRKTLNIKIGLPTPAFALYLGKYVSRVEPSLILTSLYAQPKKLLDSGYQFSYPDMASALQEILNSKK